MRDGGIVFRDRREAGRALAEPLLRYREEHPIVLGLPRGGVVIGFEVALALAAPLDVVVARKLGAPMQPELGIGAVAPGGVRVLDERIAGALGLRREEIERIVAREIAEMERRARLYRGDRPDPEVRDRTAIVVDDGLATGVTARAALQAVRRWGPRKLVLAAPVCAADTAVALRETVDAMHCLIEPVEFAAVGLWYREFEQLSDEDVIALLEEARALASERGRT